MKLISLYITATSDDLSQEGGICAGVAEDGSSRYFVWYWVTEIDASESCSASSASFEVFVQEVSIGGTTYLFRCRDGNDLLIAYSLVCADLERRIRAFERLDFDPDDIPF